MQIVTEKAIVLKSSPYKDSDKIYTFFSQESGKFVALGKGVRSIKSKRNGNLDTLNLVNVTYRKTPNDYKFISEASTINSFSGLKSDLNLSTAGYYFSELVYRLFEEDSAYPEVFSLLKRSLNLLDENVFDLDLIETYFEINLLNALGYSLILDSCVYCERPLTEIDLDSNIKLDFTVGGIICDSCARGHIQEHRVSSKAKGLMPPGFGIKISKKDIFLLMSLAKGVFPKEKNLKVSFDTKNILKAHFMEVAEIQPKAWSFFTHVSRSY